MALPFLINKIFIKPCEALALLVELFQTKASFIDLRVDENERKQGDIS